MTEILKKCDSQISCCARRWIGTPFRHQGRSRKAGVDCLGLLVAVALELRLCDANGQLLARFDALDYGHLPDEKRLYAGLSKVLKKTEGVEPGVVGLFRIDGTARHLAIVGQSEQGYLTLIHAYAPARQVVEHRFDEAWRQKLVAVFSI